MTLSGSIPRLFIAGLGNLPYPSTRHRSVLLSREEELISELDLLQTVGHLVIDALANRLDIRMSSIRGGFKGQGNVCLSPGPDGTSVDLTLFKSKSLMNVSGPSIVQGYRQWLSSPNSGIKSYPLIVITDSLSHRPLTLSPKLGGSANGHNGIKSILSALGGLDFYRFRIGIGRAGDGSVDAADYVMGPLSKSEIDWWIDEGLDKILKEVHNVVGG